MAVSVLNYLRIHRVDQAEKQVRAMSTIDDDATITQLATACVNLFLVSLCCCCFGCRSGASCCQLTAAVQMCNAWEVRC